MSPTRIVMIRHGQSTWNASGRWQGHADAPLTDLGRAQAARAVASVPAVDLIWASDLERARATADVIAGALGLTVRVDPRLRERNAGEWTGLTRDEIDRGWPRFLTNHKRPAGFEHDGEVLTRVLAALGDLHEQHPGGDVLVVTHGGVLRALERHCGSVDRAFPNLGGRRFGLDASNGELEVSAGDRLFLLDANEATYTTSPQQL